jgi:sensor histidine kinase YesM
MFGNGHSLAKSGRRCKWDQQQIFVDLFWNMNTSGVLLRYKLHHVLFWLVLGAFWFYLRYQDYSTTNKAVLVTVVKVLDLALMVYLANEVVIPKFLYRRRYALFATTLLAMILISSSVKMYVLGSILNSPALYQWTTQLKTRIYDNVLPHIFLVIAGMAFKLLVDHNKMQKRLLQIAREKAETELSFLKSQINPHFLFNSLNAVYFLIDKNNTEARQALHKFSDMLRYQLYEVKDEKIPIEKELRYLQDYIGLQKLRNDQCAVELKVEESLESFLIEPLLLLPFVENSFKHLSHYNDGKRNEVTISLAKQNGTLEFSVQNTTEGSGSPSNSGGIGLANVKRRLELLYPQKHQLQVAETEGWFQVQLKIKIDEE